ncbi:hypothetical protein AMYBAR_002499 [Amycolatopsis bartoniae]|uniref:Xylan 1,4-beta-xylosidase n=2 Tax=Amycolatopsis bartoniae TaxID=941986 RepID=A0A8H9MD58_9PSEU|nr:hypothetical protein [Amycolatopsis bartoniae]TVT09799.1 hypothetical protein FNH07_07635 [Amycolatopsis bartoniae]GHF67649.1 hypothetical protein GCM10017566_46720 [Amycolatopsis bartoniae]
MVAALLTAIGSWLPDIAQPPVDNGGMLLGVTHAQHSLDPSLPDAERQAGERILSASPMLQNQHIMGFGALNPEPSPGQYDWSSLDDRIGLIRRTQGTAVLTLCCAPDWMKGGKAGSTDWTKLTDAPLPEHYKDFAALAAKVAQRYPEVRYFQVWNELKGFWNTAGNTWDAKGFTDFYNQVYDAVKKVRPDAQVGGPYAVFTLFSSGNPNSMITGPYGRVDERVLAFYRYWNDHAHGADFVAVDGSTTTWDKGMQTTPAEADAFYTDVTRWVRNLTGLPVWWSEFYPTAAADNDQARSAATLDAIAHAEEAGAAAMLLWQPEASPDLPYGALWTDPGTGKVAPTSLTEAWQWLVPRLRAKTVKVVRDVEDNLLKFVGPSQTLTVNLSASAQLLHEGGTTITLGPFAVNLG